MINKSEHYKELAIEKIKELFEGDIPKIYRNEGNTTLETTKIMKLKDFSDYDKGKLVGFMRALVELLELKDEDFE